MNVTQTWNAGAVAFTATLVNIADTASASGSLLFNYQIAGTSKGKLDKSGNATFAGSVTMSTAGGGLLIKEGSNATSGAATLSAGTVVVSTTKVTASSRIIPTAQDNNTIGALRISARVDGTSFTITSSVLTDTGVVAWVIVEPA